jgi:hypothetical protein
VKLYVCWNTVQAPRPPRGHPCHNAYKALRDAGHDPQVKDLVAERTRAQNRLRWHLLELCPELERSLGRGAPAEPRQLARIDRRLCRLPACARVRIAREQLAQLRVLPRRVDALERELHALVKAHRPQLLAETGCGALTAALLIGRTRRRATVPKRRQLRPPERPLRRLARTSARLHAPCASQIQPRATPLRLARVTPRRPGVRSRISELIGPGSRSCA